MQLICEGKPNRQIARELCVSENQIKKHLSNAYSRLDVNSRSSAIARLRELMIK
jgi:LuxR family transcriptional regulator, maltose regulon positive regulatory protein